MAITFPSRIQPDGVIHDTESTEKAYYRHIQNIPQWLSIIFFNIFFSSSFETGINSIGSLDKATLILSS
ncbi:hypothetical protein DCO56_25655 [Sphingobacterium athyrii]|uniref:Uncharacterized protein n=1 Tax=Sphingobacterium athyrii TaxID=2152717 RepID=A0A363NLS5_9SPHI|nr:hypothetical protein DCO56_25655 [Sphingobacterium athyrii]